MIPLSPVASPIKLIAPDNKSNIWPEYNSSLSQQQVGVLCSLRISELSQVVAIKRHFVSTRGLRAGGDS